MVIVISLTLFNVQRVFAFIEFQRYIEEKSNKQLNCAYCHAHINGPEGDDIGQSGSLSEEQKKLTAFNQYLSDSKKLVDSPILNKFGNYLVKQIGYDALVEAQGDPDLIVKRLKNSDLDKDGIPDSREFLDGTLPQDPLDGNPLLLFINNMKKNLLEIGFQALMIFLLIIAILKLNRKK